MQRKWLTQKMPACGLCMQWRAGCLRVAVQLATLDKGVLPAYLSMISREASLCAGGPCNADITGSGSPPNEMLTYLARNLQTPVLCSHISGGQVCSHHLLGVFLYISSYPFLGIEVQVSLGYVYSPPLRFS